MHLFAVQTVDGLAFVAEGISFELRTQGLWCPWPGINQAKGGLV